MHHTSRWTRGARTAAITLWTVTALCGAATRAAALPTLLPFGDLAGSQWLLQDQLEPVACERDGGDLQSRGLYLDARPWQSSAFALTRTARVGNPQS